MFEIGGGFRASLSPPLTPPHTLKDAPPATASLSLPPSFSPSLPPSLPLSLPPSSSSLPPSLCPLLGLARARVTAAGPGALPAWRRP
eukprot:1739578-Rhodomonas_salina.1